MELETQPGETPESEGRTVTSANDFEQMSASLPSGASNLDRDAADALALLVTEWRAHYQSNLLRSEYYDAREKVRNLGISIPDGLASRVGSVVGWPAKAVRALADLSQYDGLDAADADTLGLVPMARRAGLDVTVQQAVTSAYKHGCAFLASYVGRDGLPRVMCRSALMSSAIWDLEEQEPACAMTITRVDPASHAVTGVMLFLPGRLVQVSADGGVWSATSTPQAYAGVAVTPVVSDPQLDKPLGRSMITRPLMGYTAAAVRTLVRMEASAEFYSVPQLWFLGLDPDALDAGEWTTLISRINGVSKDVDGDVPTMHQLTQASMQPHSDMLATLARMAAGETDLPVSDFGIVSSNPTSAEAMAEAERKLTRRADRQNRIFQRAILRALGVAWCLQSGEAALPDGLDSYTPVFAPTREESSGARGDFFQKVASVAPSYATLPVAWRRLGFTADEASQLASQARRAQASDTIGALTKTALTGV
ncbi:phage portal protein [Pseudoscardovia suis]